MIVKLPLGHQIRASGISCYGQGQKIRIELNGRKVVDANPSPSGRSINHLSNADNHASVRTKLKDGWPSPTRATRSSQIDITKFKNGMAYPIVPPPQFADDLGRTGNLRIGSLPANRVFEGDKHNVLTKVLPWEVRSYTSQYEVVTGQNPSAKAGTKNLPVRIHGTQLPRS